MKKPLTEFEIIMLKDRIEKLKKRSVNDSFRLIFEWVKTENLTLREFQYVIENLFINKLKEKIGKLTILATKDELTGLFNRRSLDKLLLAEHRRFKRYEIPFTCLMIDIDFFKKINDEYGHPFGDFILSEIAKIFKNNLRETDICCRYGGEEFFIIMHGDLEKAKNLAERLHENIREHVFEDQQHSTKLTVSIGISKDTAGSPEEIINSADKALYHVKENGRNQTFVWE